MEEKVLIKSEHYNVSKVCIAIMIIGAVLSVLIFSVILIDNCVTYADYYTTYKQHEDSDYHRTWCNTCEFIEDHPFVLGYVIGETFGNYNILYGIIPFIALTVVGSLIYLWLHSYELTVTDKRIYGKVAWGKRVDLPVDSVSAIATTGVLKGVSVSTSSGKIAFLIIKNADEIYKVLNNLLIERQQEKVNATISATMPKSDEADQLKKYKELLESGVITQEEFDAKKKQLLGL